MKKGKLRLSPDKWTLEEFEKIQKFREQALDSSKEYGNINAWENILQVCGMTSKEFDAMTVTEFHTLINTVVFESANKHQRVIEVNGVKFIGFEKGAKFNVGAREAGAIERIAKAKNGITYPEIMACLLTKEGETREDKLTTNSINEKALVLRDMVASLAVPYLASWTEACLEVIKIGQNEPTE